MDLIGKRNESGCMVYDLDNWRNYLQTIGATYLSHGKDREVWKHKQFVIKLPLHEYGLLANERENRIYKNIKNDGIKYAACRILKSGLLIMECIDPLAISDGDLPEWAKYIDGCQIGRNKQGMIVAFDYA